MPEGIVAILTKQVRAVVIESWRMVIVQYVLFKVFQSVGV